MKRNWIVNALFILSLCLNTLTAASLNLKKQNKWTSSEKDAFIRSITKGTRPLLSLGKKKVQLDSGAEDEEEGIGAHAGHYVTMRYSGARFIPLLTQNLGVNQYRHGISLGFGTHIFSWVRVATGFDYQRFRLMTQPYTYTEYAQVSMPLFVELALIPLGSPHTRYIILRGGVLGMFAWQLADGHAKSLDMHVTGPIPEGLLTLGYEWQLGENFWRVSTAVDARYPLVGPQEREYLSFGASIGTTYVF